MPGALSYNSGMKTSRIAFMALAVIAVSAFALAAQDGPEFPKTSIRIQRIPATIEEFTSLRDSLAGTPEGGAAVFVVALYLYTANQALGLQALTVALDAGQLSSDARGYQGFSPSSSYNFYFQQLQNAQHIARSYFAGTSPANAYALPSGPQTIEIVRNPYSVISDAEIRVYVYSTGADTPRPLTLKKNNRGVWKASSTNSLFVGVRPPIVVVDDAL